VQRTHMRSAARHWPATYLRQASAAELAAGIGAFGRVSNVAVEDRKDVRGRFKAFGKVRICTLLTDYDMLHFLSYRCCKLLKYLGLIHTDCGDIARKVLVYTFGTHVWEPLYAQVTYKGVRSVPWSLGHH
jgi:hypothetical protein